MRPFRSSPDRVARAALLAAVLGAACTPEIPDHDAQAKAAWDSSAAAHTAAAPMTASEPLGDGDVRVTSTDGSFVMSVVGDSIRMQLSDSLRQSVRHDIDSSTDTSGIGGMIAHSVGGIVASAMGFVIRIPVQSVQNVRYENGQIRFETKGGRISTSSRDTDDRRSKAQFSPSDGERFVEAVKARQAALGEAR